MSGLNVYLEVINGLKIHSQFILLAEKIRKQKIQLVKPSAYTAFLKCCTFIFKEL